MHIVQALIRGFIVCLALVIIFLILSYSIKPPETVKHTSAPVTKIRLNQQNVVDMLVDHINTERLHAVQLQDRTLHVELGLLPEDDPDYMIYKLTPEYVSLAFDYSNNIEKLVVEFMLIDKEHHMNIKYIDLTIKYDDLWLNENRQMWLSRPWLEHPVWRELLRIEQHYNWKDNQVVMR